MDKKFTVYQHGALVAGLQRIGIDNANLMMLVPEKSFTSLEVDGWTWAFDKFGNKYYIVRDN
jgi:hypothetical protein